MASPDNWPEPGLHPIIPPPEIALPGRPKKKRNRSNDEPPTSATKQSRKGQRNHCSKCRQTGHSIVTCPNAATVQVHSSRVLHIDKAFSLEQGIQFRIAYNMLFCVVGETGKEERKTSETKS